MMGLEKWPDNHLDFADGRWGSAERWTAVWAAVSTGVSSGATDFFVESSPARHINLHFAERNICWTFLLLYFGDVSMFTCFLLIY